MDPMGILMDTGKIKTSLREYMENAWKKRKFFLPSRDPFCVTKTSKFDGE